MTDFVIIELQAGDGGKGKVSFRREWRVPRGGPDGGDGGDGGSIVIKVVSTLSTLDAMAGKKIIKASPGGNGDKRKKSGRKAQDVIIEVPPGTVVWQITENQTAHRRRLRSGIEKLAKRSEVYFEKYELEKEGQQVPTQEKDDLLDPEKIGQVLRNKQFKPKKDGLIELLNLADEGTRVTICQGGFGGRGNTHFKSSTRTTPFIAEHGSLGEKRALVFELKLLADIGFVGYPNAGKSTLLSRLTKARPKIAEYPFTTLEPNLGIYQHPQSGHQFVMADIPGLIEGANQGKGLGYQFLRHIENCQTLLFLLALDDEQLSKQKDHPGEVVTALWEQWQKLNDELKDYRDELANKQKMVLLNKIDLYSDEVVRLATKKFKEHGLDLQPISAATGDGLANLHQHLLQSAQVDATS